MLMALMESRRVSRSYFYSSQASGFLKMESRICVACCVPESVLRPSRGIGCAGSGPKPCRNECISLIKSTLCHTNMRK